MRRTTQKATNEGWLTSYADLITNLLIFFILIISVSQIQPGKFEKVMAEISDSKASKTSLSAAKEQLEDALAEQDLSDDVTVQLDDDGLRVSFNSGVTFPSGSAEILPAMEEPLAKVLAELVPYTQNYSLAVEGHTDERPIASQQYKSNWELASARALKVRERLESVGVAKSKIRVEAYADNKPLVGQEIQGLDDATRLARHRRVVVRLF